MSKSASIVEVNGNRYDAVTGQVVGAVKRVAAQVRNPGNGTIDGLVRKPTITILSSAKQPGASATSKASNTGLRTRLQYKIPSTRQRLQHSQTLMRNAVKRPVLLQSTKNLDIGPRIQKSPAATINPAHAEHAKTTPKNTRVKRFGKLQISAKTHKAVTAQTSAKKINHTNHAAAGALSKPLPSVVTSVSHQNLERLLDHALTQADAHKHALKARTKSWHRLTRAPKWLSFGASALALLLLVGFFAWQNIPQLSMSVAAARSHVSAAVPAYTPTGFGVAGPVSASANKVTISYRSTANSQQGFAITQESSKWDSGSVQANAVPAGSQVQTSQVNGTTVYIYGNGNDAKWVNHGVLFSLKDKANLSSDQILKIANGL